MGVVGNGRDPYSNVPETTKQQDEGRDDIPGPNVSVETIAYWMLTLLVLAALAIGVFATR